MDPIRVSISATEDNTVTLAFSSPLDQTLTLDDMELLIYTMYGNKIDVTYTLVRLKDDIYEIYITSQTEDITEESIFNVVFTDSYLGFVPISPIDQTLNTDLYYQDSEKTKDEENQR